MRFVLTVFSDGFSLKDVGVDLSSLNTFIEKSFTNVENVSIDVNRDEYKE